MKSTMTHHALMRALRLSMVACGRPLAIAVLSDQPTIDARTRTAPMPTNSVYVT
jgi:hypothetical protein